MTRTAMILRDIMEKKGDLVYMAKEISAYGGCLGSKRRRRTC